MANKTLYNMIGRCVNSNDARDIVGYKLQSTDGRKCANFTIEQTAFLIGSGQVQNCDAQLYKDKVLFRGIGIALSDLPCEKVSVKGASRVDTVTPPSIKDTHRENIVKPSVDPNTQEYVIKAKEMLDKSVETCRKTLQVECTDKNSKVDTSKKVTAYARLKSAKYNIAIVVTNSPDMRNATYELAEATYKIRKRADSIENTAVKSTLAGFIRDILSVSERKSDRSTPEVVKPVTSTPEIDTIEKLDIYSRYYCNSTLESNELMPLEMMLGLRKDAYTKQDLISNYDKIVKYLDAKYNGYAYKYTLLAKFANDIVNTYINIDGKTSNGLVYVSMNKWGFVPDTPLKNERDWLIISESALACVEAAFPDRITHIKITGDKSYYRRAHYHDVIIRLRAFRHVKEYKNLKSAFIKLNRTIFDSKIPMTVVVSAGLYSKESREIKDDKELTELGKTAAYNSSTDQEIMFNARYSTLQNNELDEKDEATLIHEMCHAYVNEVYGSSWETNPADFGDAVYGISREKYGKQVEAHGRRFGKAIEMAASRCKYSFGTLFSYGLKAEEVRDLPDDSYIQTVERGMFRVYKDDNRVISKYFVDWWEHNSPKIKAEINRYKNYFYDTMNCVLDIKDNPECADASIFMHVRCEDSSFDEVYRLNAEPMPSKSIKMHLYRDYMNEGKGYKLKGFIVKDTNDMSATIKSIMKQINSDIVNV